MHTIFFSISGKTPLGQPIPGCNPQSPQSSPSQPSDDLIVAPGRSGSHCCCSPQQFGFCPNPRDYEGGFVSFLNLISFKKYIQFFRKFFFNSFSWMQSIQESTRMILLLMRVILVFEL